MISDKLRLNAKRKYENSVKKFLDTDTSATNSNNVGVIFSKEQNEQKKL